LETAYLSGKAAVVHVSLVRPDGACHLRCTYSWQESWSEPRLHQTAICAKLQTTQIW